jgi:hypothetical protein
MYYNTTNKTGEDLKQSNAKTDTQEQRILAIFQLYKVLSPFEVEAIYNRSFRQVPITSIRRGITNLSNQGKLIKTNRKTTGRYGEKNHLWEITGQAAAKK